jgi:hypothetical protein
VDPWARDALQTLIRRELTPALDELCAELSTLRRQVVTLQQLAGLPTQPGRLERREQAAAMRVAGHSVRSIAGTLGVGRGTIQHDLALMRAAPPPAGVIGLDGRLTQPRLRPPAA